MHILETACLMHKKLCLYFENKKLFFLNNQKIKISIKLRLDNAFILKIIKKLFFFLNKQKAKISIKLNLGRHFYECLKIDSFLKFSHLLNDHIGYLLLFRMKCY